MSFKVLIVPDKFKGTLTARAAARTIAKGWSKVRTSDSVHPCPMSDGGDGFGEVISALFGAKVQMTKTVDAAHRTITAHWWWEPRKKIAIIESASVIGLAKLPPGRFHPFELDTLGLATMVRAAAAKGAKRCLIGIGGSATNDGGFGLARGLGWEFLDAAGDSIERWTQLHRLVRVRSPREIHWFDETLVAVDVRNPLLGPRGASRIYGPQKGLRKEDFEASERCLRRLARVVKKQFATDVVRMPGAGAAGGLGFGLLAFMGARLEPGFDLFVRYSKLEQQLKTADLVVTGEGSIDKSTLMGKGVGQLAKRCRKLKIPCLGIAGMIGAGVGERRVFNQLHALTDFTTLSEAKARPAFWLERLASESAKQFLETSQV